MYNVQCAMCNDYFLRERSVTAAQLHTPHSSLFTLYFPHCKKISVIPTESGNMTEIFMFCDFLIRFLYEQYKFFRKGGAGVRWTPLHKQQHRPSRQARRGKPFVTTKGFPQWGLTQSPNIISLRRRI